MSWSRLAAGNFLLSSISSCFCPWAALSSSHLFNSPGTDPWQSMEGTYGQRHCLFTAIRQLTHVGSRLSLSLSHDQVCIVTLFSCATALSSRHCFIPQLHSPPGHWSMLIRLLLTRFMLRFPGRISSPHIPACPPAISSYRPIATSLSSLS